ncbi:hypothetical protein [Nonomuraea sp. SYSU D8015]|uniref:hypothetical protein n=1 Tax=Nonomuraea sp. SYSU D8015 TaxID=2593644 RepID=UPI0016605E74|nr:hypothetical protein [Nonomuraea sp. SYSU D8015]
MNTGGAANIGETRPETEELQVTWAYVTLMTPQGMVVTTDDPSMLADKIKPVRQPTADEIDGACATTRTDIAAQKTAAQVHHGMMAAARASQEQAMTQQIMQNMRMPGQ